MLERDRYRSSLQPSAAIDVLEADMKRFYHSLTYHREWIDGYNKAWTEDHLPQLATTAKIPAGTVMLEIGCGAGDAKVELCKRVPGLRYFGVDLNWRLWPKQEGFISASATAIPFANKSADVVLSMYVIEHMCRPRDFLDEAWRVARQAVMVVAPDFTSNPMASEWSGLSYGAGRDKLKQGKIFDALLTGFANRVIAVSRLIRAIRLRSGAAYFPVLINPRCLKLPGFVPDCDAVYPVCPLEIRNYYSAKADFESAEVFYNDGSAFGAIYKKEAHRP